MEAVQGSVDLVADARVGFQCIKVFFELLTAKGAKPMTDIELRQAEKVENCNTVSLTRMKVQCRYPSLSAATKLQDENDVHRLGFATVEA